MNILCDNSLLFLGHFHKACALTVKLQAFNFTAAMEKVKLLLLNSRIVVLINCVISYWHRVKHSIIFYSLIVFWVVGAGANPGNNQVKVQGKTWTVGLSPQNIQQNK